MDSIVFLTTPTSATASAWRILTRVSRGVLSPNRYTDSFYEKSQLASMASEVLPGKDQLLLFNTPAYFNLTQNLGELKYIINVRDPRDLLCNMYHWALIHPEPGLSESDLIARRESLKAKGIDEFVVGRDVSSYYENILKLVGLVDSARVCYATYANLCCDFDKYVERIAEFIGVELVDEIKSDLESERVENLRENRSWIGNKWAGSDVLPGRYKNELEISTIKLLNNRYKSLIKFCELADAGRGE